MLPSIDQVAAKIIGKTDRFSSLELGVSNRLDTVEGTTLHYLSHSGPDSPNPPEYNPVNVYNRIFGMGFTPPGAAPPPVADSTIGFRKSVMDVVLGDLTRLRGRVGVADRARLDKHTDNVRSIENRLTGVGPMGNAMSCKLPVKERAGKARLPRPRTASLPRRRRKQRLKSESRARRSQAPARRQPPRDERNKIAPTLKVEL